MKTIRKILSVLTSLCIMFTMIPFINLNVSAETILNKVSSIKSINDIDFDSSNNMYVTYDDKEVRKYDSNFNLTRTWTLADFSLDSAQSPIIRNIMIDSSDNVYVCIGKTVSAVNYKAIYKIDVSGNVTKFIDYHLYTALIYVGSNNESIYAFCANDRSISKYNSNGTLDTSWGNSGKITVSDNSLNTMYIDDSGIYVSTDNVSHIVKYTLSGALDTSWNVSSLTGIGDENCAVGMTSGSDGNLYVVTTDYGSNNLIYCLNKSTGAFIKKVVDLPADVGNSSQTIKKDKFGNLYIPTLFDGIYKVEEVSSTHTVSFNSNSGSSVSNITDISNGSKISEPPAPTRTGYTFGGWYKDNNTFADDWDFSNDTVASSTTLYAKWNLQTYNITYHLDGGTNHPSNPSTTNYETAVNFYSATKTNNIFGGWYLEPECTNVVTAFTKNAIFKDIDLYAKWIPTYTISGTVKFGGTGLSGVTLSYTDNTAKTVTTDSDGNYTITVPKNWAGTVTPSKTGYKFTNINTDYTAITANQANQDYTALIDDKTPPTVSSIKRIDKNPINASSVRFEVKFSEDVTGVDTSDFTLFKADGANGNISSVMGTGTIYTVTINGITNEGTIRLDLNSSGTGIADTSSNAITGGFSSGESYIIDMSPPAIDMHATSVKNSGGYDIYKTSVKPEFTEGTATISKNGSDDVTFTSNTTISDDGTYVLKVTDTAGNTNTHAFIIITNVTISGTVTKGGIGVSGVTLSYTNGTAKTVTTDENGKYSISVPFDWSGTIVPSLDKYTFVQSGKTYSSIEANVTDNYTCYTVPGKPTGISVSVGSGEATVSFIEPSDNGGKTITGYIVESNTGGFSVTGASSPIKITGLTNGQSYTFTVKATNDGTNYGAVSNTSDTVLIGSSSKDISDFKIGSSTKIISGNDISITVPYNADITKLTPTFSISSSATVSPASGVEQDFTNPVTYTVTAENGTTSTYIVTVTKGADPRSTAKDISEFKIGSSTGTISGNNISITVPYKSDITKLTPTFLISSGATISPVSGAEIDFTNPVTYTVTAENGTAKNYTVTVTKMPQITYDVTFDTDGGSANPSKQKVILGGTASIPKDPIKTANEFDGWYNGTKKWNFTTDTVTGNVNLKAKWRKTIKIIETPAEIKNPEMIDIKPNGDAFNQSVEVRLKENPEVEKVIKEVLDDVIKEDLKQVTVFPLDISLYIKGTDTKVQPNEGTSVTITCPIPENLLANKDKLKVVCVINGKLNVLETKVVQIDGVWCVQFTATHFSPYAMVVDSNNVIKNTEATPNPKTDSNHLIIPMFLAVLSITTLTVVSKRRKLKVVKKYK